MAKYQKESLTMAEDREDTLNGLHRKLKSKEEELNGVTNKIGKL
jgi:hypothetical protein